ncbi:hypothetical protein [Vampirovibrio chlorellavorus]|uniref:hypothetical protein n=1 Tax=Vampirovibrio chlorellavorus TaxID=758823 RepID=UPI0026ECF16A|nr:hypothetical protein [Vampirovibrio chlorellavorus]
MFAVYMNIRQPGISEQWFPIREFENKYIAEGWVNGANNNYRGYNAMLGIRFEVREVP